jgi:integrase
LPPQTGARLGVLLSARHVLTDKQIENAKPAPARGRYMLWDAVAPSLALRVTDRGHKSFVVHRRVNGRLVMLTLGEYPALKLGEAREQAREKLREMTRGIDPRQSDAPRVTASGLRRDSFEGAVESYIKREVEKNRRPRTQDEIIRPLRKLLIPKWGSLPLSVIGPREIIAVLDELVDAGTPVAANRTYSVLRRFFRWCVERHLITTNPAIAVRKPIKEESRSRVLGDDELREVWIASEALDWPFGPFIRGLILTGQRRNELASMKWSDIDGIARQWLIPGSRTKNAKDHIIPLSKPVQALLDKAPRLVRKDETDEEQQDHPVFTTTGKTPIAGFSRAKSKLDSEILKMRRNHAAEAEREPAKVKPLPAWTLHDLRRSCATGMARIGVQPHVIEAVPNHSSGFRAGVAGIYQRHPYLEERRHALDAWADHIVQLLAPQEPTAKVISFSRNTR